MQGECNIKSFCNFVFKFILNQRLQVKFVNVAVTTGSVANLVEPAKLN